MGDSRQYGRLAVLTAFAALILALCAYKADLNADRHWRFRQRDLKQQALFDLGQEVTERLNLAMTTQIGFETFIDTFGPVTEPTNPEHPLSPGSTTYTYFHPQSQRTFDLQFHEGRLTGVSSHHSSSDIDTGVILETPAFLASESVRTLALSCGLLAWFGLLIVGIAVPRFRSTVFPVLIVLSLLCGVCWFLAPKYSPTLTGIASNDSMAGFVFLLIISLAFGVTRSVRPEDHPTSTDTHCGCV